MFKKVHIFNLPVNVDAGIQTRGLVGWKGHGSPIQAIYGKLQTGDI